MSKNHVLIFKMAITAVFTALTFALTFVNVPLATGAKVHLGNFSLVVASLLFGKYVGGISGGLGMMLNDISSGYGPNTYFRTLIVKFIFGYLIGFLFRDLAHKRNTVTKLIIILNLVFLFITVYSIIRFSTGNVNGLESKFDVYLFNQSKNVKMNILVPIFSSIVSVLLFVLFMLRNKLSNINLTVATVSSLGVIINMILEFILRWIINGFVNNNFDAAFLESVSKLPANLITGVVTVVLASALFMPTYLALKKEPNFKKVSDLYFDEVDSLN